MNRKNRRVVVGFCVLLVVVLGGCGSVPLALPDEAPGPIPAGLYIGTATGEQTFRAGSKETTQKIDPYDVSITVNAAGHLTENDQEYKAGDNATYDMGAAAVMVTVVSIAYSDNTVVVDYTVTMNIASGSQTYQMGGTMKEIYKKNIQGGINYTATVQMLAPSQYGAVYGSVRAQAVLSP